MTKEEIIKKFEEADRIDSDYFLLTYDDIEEIVDEIFKKFNSKNKICKNCSYYKGNDVKGFCLHMKNTLMNDDSNISVDAEFGCNRFERKNSQLPPLKSGSL